MYGKTTEKKEKTFVYFNGLQDSMYSTL